MGSLVNASADWLSSAPIVRGIVSNPVFTALLIVALVAIVAMALYHYQIKEAGLKRGLRALLYAFLAVLAVVFVHHYAVTRAARATATQKGIREVFSGIEQSRAGALPGSVPVVPMGFEAPRAPQGPPAPAPAPAARQGGSPVDCGCPAVASVPAVTGRGAPPALAPRLNNVAVADFVITDVVVPSAASPFGAAPPKAK